MPFGLKFLSSLALVAFASACAPAHEPSSLKIIGGRPVHPGELPWSVAVLRQGKFHCSGVVLTQKVVITAAHCIERDRSIFGAGLSSLYSISAKEAPPLTSQAKVKDSFIYPAYMKGGVGHHDLAVLLLAEHHDLPDFPPLPLLFRLTDRLLYVAPGQEVILSGFGLNTKPQEKSAAVPSVGVKFLATMPVRQATSAEFFAGSSTTDTCSGDSGGPAFASLTARVDTADVGLVGIASRGPVPCAQEKDPGVITLLSPYICWINEVAPLERPEVTRWCAGEYIQEAKGLAQARLAAAKSAALTGLDLAHLEWQGAWAEVLQQLEGMENLDLHDNQLTDAHFLLQLGHLKRVDLRQNRLKNKKIFTTLRRRGVWVVGDHTQEQDHLQLPFYTWCQKLAADPASVPMDIRICLGLIKQRLGQQSCERAAHSLQTRQWLDLANLGIKDIAPLAHLENLETLDLSGNLDLKDLSVLKTLPMLKNVTLPRP